MDHNICKQQLDKLRRDYVEINLGMDKILDHFGLPPISEEDVDRAIEAEGIFPPKG